MTAVAWPGDPIVLPRSKNQSGAQQVVVQQEKQHGVQHEVELAVIIGRRVTRCQSDAEAMASVAGFCVALDVTDRDAQTKAKVAKHDAPILCASACMFLFYFLLLI